VQRGSLIAGEDWSPRHSCEAAPGQANPRPRRRRSVTLSISPSRSLYFSSPLSTPLSATPAVLVASRSAPIPFVPSATGRRGRRSEEEGGDRDEEQNGTPCSQQSARDGERNWRARGCRSRWLMGDWQDDEDEGVGRADRNGDEEDEDEDETPRHVLSLVRSAYRPSENPDESRICLRNTRTGAIRR
jgi:hypothetical protein